MQIVLGLFLIPLVLGLSVTLVLRAWIREGAARWAIAVGLVLAVGLFVYFRYFTYHCEGGYSNCGEYDLSSLDYFLPFIGFLIWLLGVGAAAGLSRLIGGNRPPES